MKDIINTINTASAYQTILAELHLNDSDVEFSNITMHDGLYEANLFTAWMHYECYVDAATSEVLGLNAEPIRHSAYPACPRLQAGAQMKKPPPAFLTNGGNNRPQKGCCPMAASLLYRYGSPAPAAAQRQKSSFRSRYCGGTGYCMRRK